jgi:hypothetical protein
MKNKEVYKLRNIRVLGSISDVKSIFRKAEIAPFEIALLGSKFSPQIFFQINLSRRWQVACDLGIFGRRACALDARAAQSNPRRCASGQSRQNAWHNPAK